MNSRAAPKYHISIIYFLPSAAAAAKSTRLIIMLITCVVHQALCDRSPDFCLNHQNPNIMTITKEEIIKDFERFIRHEAMRANTTQDHIEKLIEGFVLYGF